MRVIICSESSNNLIRIYFNVLWTGDLSEYRLKQMAVLNPKMYMYISMPNDLVYRLYFRAKDFKADECPEETED